MDAANNGPSNYRDRSLAATFSLVLATIIVSEAAVALILHLLSLEGLWHSLIRPILLVAMIAPLLYHFIVSPIRNSLKERRRAEEELHHQQHNLQAIFEAAPMAMLLVNENTVVIRVNDAVAKFVGKESLSPDFPDSSGASETDLIV